MDKIFSEKINLLKALAIALVVSGHLEFSLMGMFTPYSFQLSLFFFISGMLFKDKYLNDVVDYLKRKTKGLLVPYFGYSVFYLAVTLIIAKLTGKYWGMPLSLKTFFVTPFLNGHQFDLSCPMWFVPQLFIVMVVFLFLMRVLYKLTTNKYIHLAFFTIMGLMVIPLSKIVYLDGLTLLALRTMFALFFVYLGRFYIQEIEGKHDIFTPKWLGAVIILQSVLWLFNRDFTPEHGIGLSYVLVWARFDDQLIVPIITSLTGIWASLFAINIIHPYCRGIKFLQYMGKTTYHIMANHLFVMYLITAVFLHINNIPLSVRNSHDIYWIYNPVQTTYFYFVVTMIITTYVGMAQKRVKEVLTKRLNKEP